MVDVIGARYEVKSGKPCACSTRLPPARKHTREAWRISAKRRAASLTASQYARDRRLLAGNDSGTVFSGESVCTSGDPFASSATGRAKCARRRRRAVAVPGSLPSIRTDPAGNMKLKLEDDRVHRQLGGIVAIRLLGEWQGRGNMADAESSGLESGAPILR